MSFSAPALLPWLGLVAIVPILYLVRRRSRRALVPHVFLWERALAAQGKSRRSRIHDLLGLILNMLIVAGFVLAAAGPQRERRVATPRSTLIILDTSLSMAARDGRGGDRAGRARALVAERIEDLAAEGPVGLLRFGRQPEWLANSGAAADDLRASLDEESENRGRFELPAFLDFVSAARERDPDLRLILCSDGAFAGGENELAGAGVEFMSVAADERNAALVACRLLERESARFRVAVEVAVSGGRLAGRLRLQVPEGQGAETEIDLEAGSKAVFELEGELAGAGFVELLLEAEGDSLGADDRLELKLERDPRLRLLVVADEVGSHLESALAALDEVFDPAAAAKASPADWRRADLSSFDLVLMRGVEERAPLPPGRYILIDSFAPGLPFKRLGPVEQPAILRQERTGSLLRGLDLRDLEVGRAEQLKPVGAVEILLDSDAGPLISRTPNLVHLAFDCSEEASSLVLLPAFPLLLKDAARNLVPRAERVLPPVAAAGRPNDLQGVLPRGAILRETGAAEGRASVNLRLTDARFLAPARLGRARLAWGDRQEELGLALLDELASDLAARIVAGAAEPEPPRRERSRQSVTIWVLALTLGLLLLEWLFFSRGWSR